MIHELKINQCYLIHICEKRKSFEIRKNDRDFQVGDTIKFLPLEDENYSAYKNGFHSQKFNIVTENSYRICQGLVMAQRIKKC
jgi:hypothetical protein